MENVCACQWHRKLALTVPRCTDLFVVTFCAQCVPGGTSTVIQLLAVVYEQDRRRQADGDVVFGAMWLNVSVVRLRMVSLLWRMTKLKRSDQRWLHVRTVHITAFAPTCKQTLWSYVYGLFMACGESLCQLACNGTFGERTDANVSQSKDYTSCGT